MYICEASNKNGSSSVSFSFDSRTLETWFEVYIAVYTRDDGERIVKGLYKTYIFKTLKAAMRKHEYLTEKYNIR